MLYHLGKHFIISVINFVISIINSMIQWTIKNLCFKKIGEKNVVILVTLLFLFWNCVHLDVKNSFNIKIKYLLKTIFFKWISINSKFNQFSSQIQTQLLMQKKQINLIVLKIIYNTIKEYKRRRLWCAVLILSYK